MSISLPTPPEATPYVHPYRKSSNFEFLPTKPEASGSSLLVNVPKRDEVCALSDSCVIRVTTYAKSAELHWPVERKPQKTGKPPCTPQGNLIWTQFRHAEAGFVTWPKKRRIGSMSTKSRLRAVFAFLNAPSPWSHMVTLTFPEQPACPREALNKLCRTMRETLDMHHQWGWIMEYQKKGRVHYHLFLSAAWMDTNFPNARDNTEVVGCGGNARVVSRGAIDLFFVSAWKAAVGCYDASFCAFQEGGIVEPFRSSEGAARYVAKEAGKRCQKKLPPGIKGGNRWWFLSPEGSAKATGFYHLSHYPLEKGYRVIFDKTILEDFLLE